MATNGPAIWEGYGTCFCSHGTNLVALMRDRGTSLIGTANLSPGYKFDGGHWCSVAKIVSKLEICQGAGF